jgi:hypothetical protein
MPLKCQKELAPMERQRPAGPMHRRCIGEVHRDIFVFAPSRTQCTFGAMPPGRRRSMLARTCYMTAPLYFPNEYK